MLFTVPIYQAIFLVMIGRLTLRTPKVVTRSLTSSSSTSFQTFKFSNFQVSHFNTFKQLFCRCWVDLSSSHLSFLRKRFYHIKIIFWIAYSRNAVSEHNCELLLKEADFEPTTPPPVVGTLSASSLIFRLIKVFIIERFNGRTIIAKVFPYSPRCGTWCSSFPFSPSFSLTSSLATKKRLFQQGVLAPWHSPQTWTLAFLIKPGVWVNVQKPFQLWHCTWNQAWYVIGMVWSHKQEIPMLSLGLKSQTECRKGLIWKNWQLLQGSLPVRWEEDGLLPDHPRPRHCRHAPQCPCHCCFPSLASLSQVECVGLSGWVGRARYNLKFWGFEEPLLFVKTGAFMISQASK